MKNNRGFIKGILLIIIIVLLLAYFKVDLKNIFESDLVSGWITFVVERLKYLWRGVLVPWFDSFR
ncbi:MAG: hypothetical protein AAB453_01430 [Patescibacteria group bacterium]